LVVSLILNVDLETFYHHLGLLFHHGSGLCLLLVDHEA
jgi:hypothetical protein